MRSVTLVVTCMVLASQGAGVQIMSESSESAELYSNGQEQLHDPLRVLAMFFLACDPTAAWQAAGMASGRRSPLSPPSGMVQAINGRALAPTMDYILNEMTIPNPLQPVGNYVLVKLDLIAEQKTGSGVFVGSDSASEGPSDGLVVAAGPGTVDADTAKLLPCPCKKGDVVLLPSYGGETVEYEGVQHLLLDAGSVLGVFEGGEKSIASVRPLQDRIMFAVPENQKETDTGIMIAGKGIESEMNAGEVIAVGPGRSSSSAEAIAPVVKVGEKVVCQPDIFDEVEIEGKKLRFVREPDCLATW